MPLSISNLLCIPTKKQSRCRVQIHLESPKPSYTPGDVVKGTASILVPRDTELDHVQIILEGIETLLPLSFMIAHWANRFPSSCFRQGSNDGSSVVSEQPDPFHPGAYFPSTEAAHWRNHLHSKTRLSIYRPARYHISLHHSRPIDSWGMHAV